MKDDLLKRVRKNQANMGLVGTITLPADLHHELVAEIKRLRSELREIKEEVVEYVHDGDNFNWVEAVIAIRHWREAAEAAEAKET